MSEHVTVAQIWPSEACAGLWRGVGTWHLTNNKLLSSYVFIPVSNNGLYFVNNSAVEDFAKRAGCRRRLVV